jgi:hypothetical protein
MKLKKVLMSLVAVGMMALTATAFAATKTVAKQDGIHSLLSAKNKAIATAKLEVPANSNYFGTKNKAANYVVKFQDPATLDYYDVTVEKATDKVKHVTISGSNFPGSVTAKILESYPAATNIVVTLEDDPNGQNLKIYKATFTTPKFDGVAQLNPATCLYGHRELSYK